MVFRIRDLRVRQGTQALNTLRGHPGHFAQIVPQGAANAARLTALVDDTDNVLPADLIAALKVLVAALSDPGRRSAFSMSRSRAGPKIPK